MVHAWTRHRVLFHVWDLRTRSQSSLVLICPNSKGLCVAEVADGEALLAEGETCFPEQPGTWAHHSLFLRSFPHLGTRISKAIYKASRWQGVFYAFCPSTVFSSPQVSTLLGYRTPAPLCEGPAVHAFSAGRAASTPADAGAAPLLSFLGPRPHPANGAAILRWKTLSKHSVGPGRLART